MRGRSRRLDWPDHRLTCGCIPCLARPGRRMLRIGRVSSFVSL